MISYFVKEMELDKYNNFEDIEKRDLASSIVNILSKKKGKRSFNPKYEKIAIEIIDSYKGQWDELLKINQILTLLRNDMNHAGYGRKSITSPKKFYKVFAEKILSSPVIQEFLK